MLSLAAILVLAFIFLVPALAGQDEPSPPLSDIGAFERGLQERSPLVPEGPNLQQRVAGAIADAVGAIPGVPALTDSVIENIAAPAQEAFIKANPEVARAVDPEAFGTSGIIDPDIARELRFQKQCFLAYNMVAIHEKVAELRGTITSPQYHTVILSDGSAAPADITSLIVSRPDIHELMQAKPFLLSYFIPHVRIFKVFGTDDLPSEGTDGRPTEEVEFVFNDHVTNSRVEDIMTNRAGRGDGVGLMSFNWQFLGVNPAEVENNIKAQLSLYFNNMKDFEMQRRARENRNLTYRFSDLIIAEPLYAVNADQREFPAIQNAFNPNFFRLKVEVGWTLPTRSEEARNLFDESGVDFDELIELTRLNKKVMYLNLIAHDLNFNDDGSVELSIDYQGLIEGTFTSPQSDILNVQVGRETAQAVAVLEQTQDDARIAENFRRGRCGRSDAPALDQLVTPSGTTVVNETQREDIDELIESIATYQSAAQGALNVLQDQDRARAYQAILQRLGQSNNIYNITVTAENLGFAMGTTAGLGFGEEQDIVVADLSPDARRQFTEAWIQTHGVAVPEPEAVPPSTWQSLFGFLTGSPPDIDERRVSDQSALRRAIQLGRLYSPRSFTVEDNFSVSSGLSGNPALAARCGLNTPVDQLLTDRLQNVDFDYSSATQLNEGIDSSFDAQQIEEAIQNIQAFIQLGPSDASIPLEFMFFGDILDVVLYNAAEWLRESNVGIYMGVFPYNDPSGYIAGEPVGEPVFVPLSYIPISVELFSVWFFEEIVEKNRSQMSIRQFIRSALDKLIINAYGSECVFDPTGEFVLTQENFSVIPEFYTIPKEKLAQAGMYRNEKLGLPSGITEYDRMYRAIRQSRNPVRLLDYDESAQFSDYTQVVLYQARSSDSGAGDIYDSDIAADGYVQTARNDIERGVYHLNIGSDRGLVKNISFERIDQDYLMEARLSAAGELGSFGQLRQRYNATVTLYGNMFFYPGQYIFINPSMVGVGDDRNTTTPSVEGLTTKLGIGGYFLVKEVENIVESGLFETILSCTWVYSGFQIEGGRSSDCNPVKNQLSRAYATQPTVREEPGVNEGVTRIITTSEEGEETVRIRVSAQAQTDTYDIY